MNNHFIIFRYTAAVILCLLLQSFNFLNNKYVSDKPQSGRNVRTAVSLTGQCSPISSLDCPALVKSLPYSLNFTGSEGGLQDKNGAATGFTMVDKPSAPLTTPTNVNIPGYEPSKLQITAGKFMITTTAGISYLNPAQSPKTNSQVNALGIGFVAPSKFTVQTTLVQPDAGTGKSEQAGLWFGLDEDNYVKLAVLSKGGGASIVEMRKEIAAISSAADYRSSGSMTLSSSLVKLKLLIDKAANTIEAFYCINGGTELSLGILSLSQSLTAGKTLSDGVTQNITFSGVYATHRNAVSALTYNFEDFKVQLLEIPKSNLKVNFQNISTIPPSDWLCDYGQPFGLRTSAYQGSGASYGWKNISDKTPLDLTKNGRLRSSPADVLLATFMHMQGNHVANFTGTPVEGIWEAQVANGNYDVTVSAGDGTEVNSKHFINVEGVKAIVNFIPSASVRFKSATVSVTVKDGFLTIDAIGGTNSKINWVTIFTRPSVVSVNPLNNATNISENTSISTDILSLPNSGINNATITSSSAYLTENATGVVVASNVNGTGGGDAITLVPASPLKLNTTYKFNITSGVKDLSGASFIPYTSLFTTKSNATSTPVIASFSRIDLPNAGGRHSTLSIGPDGKLYALTIDGLIKRFSINPDGTLATPQILYSLQDAYGTRQQRLAIGFAFDPAATATNLIAWITHSSFVFLNGPEWDGKLTKLSGGNLQIVQDVVINLPRSAKDHLTNSIAFGPDGALYFTQGSNSAMGSADTTWGWRNENLLSGAVLRLDRSKLAALPLNVKTSEGGGNYNPYLSTSPLTIYASGIRNAYDLLWHSNGQLYVPANGSAAGGNTPASVQGTVRPDGTTYNGPSVPSLNKIQQTQKDFLFRLTKGGYYGHPNALRGEYVLNGGNPTASVDSAQVNAYPVGTLPDANWRRYSFDFHNNKSPNGVIEYKSNTFNDSLKGKILVVRYSQNDDIITLTPGGANKDIINSYEGASIPGFTGFIDPLDLVENVNNGNIYVSEYGGDGKIVLLKPMISTNAATPIETSSEVIMSTDNKNSSISATDNTSKDVQISASTIGISPCDEPSVIIVPSIMPDKDLPAPVDNAVTLSSQNNLLQPKLYPNPVKKTFNIEFPAFYERNILLQIADPIGRIYDLGKFNLVESGSRIIKANISNLFLKNGVYVLIIHSDLRKNQVIKFVVQND